MESIKTQKDEPSLEEWMSKIREKKLKPVVINEHKAKDTLPARTDRPMGPHNANDIVKLRQGLRSVSTPKWPGANDVKAKTNTPAIPQRAQLRSVSDRPLPETRRSNISVNSNDGKEISAPEAKNAQDKQNDPEGQLPEETPKMEQKEEVGSGVTKDDDDDFPLEKETDAVIAQQEVISETKADELSASSGVVNTDKDVELVLPSQKDDTFPLDFVKTDVSDDQVQDSNETMPTPLTTSSGVFDTSTAPVSLKLPAETEDFPLDHEPKASQVDETSVPDVSLSAGVIDPEAHSGALALPSKEDLDAIKNGEQNKGLDKAISKLQPITSATKLDASSSQDESHDVNSEAPPSIKTASIDEQQESSDVVSSKQSTNPAVKVVDSARSTATGSTIKCSQCAADLEIDALDAHKCKQADMEDF